MIRPFIFGTADAHYNQTYAPAFLNSARAQGHEAAVFCDGTAPRTFQEKANYAVQRYRMLPELLTRHPAVLLVDVDSIIRRPIEIEPEYDLGVFLRPDKIESRRVLAGLFYCTSRAASFALALADAMKGNHPQWGADQHALWPIYRDLGSQYNVKQFDNRHIDWEPDSDPCIYTAKGPLRRKAAAFMDEVAGWGEYDINC
jgi:hypothetical protein